VCVAWIGYGVVCVLWIVCGGGVLVLFVCGVGGGGGGGGGGVGAPLQSPYHLEISKHSPDITCGQVVKSIWAVLYSQLETSLFD